ncbi:type I phosphomannose isomerase catalytic subunit [Defluviitalea phaphyphila]|uniref:type I phosphomannose isomerase catalytic subunit n=1 Tax=Defluviitalea phaphyphila TaxID=1473580 RepID=UPI000731CEE5|nr:type I phosphomannose isomerase catalytic subunit [Defluviitalea phaphyphila]
MQKEDLYEPLFSKGERVWRTYVGGKKIDEMMGKENIEDNHFPELWILSTVQANNSQREGIIEGICKIQLNNEEVSLLDLIKTYPEEMLGKEHSKKLKGEMGVLVKIIDSKERLTIQVHPTKEKARQYFNSDYGKTECWHILDTREDEEEEPCVYMGFKEHVTKEEFIKCFEEQDLEKMLSFLHKIKVKKGETYIIPGGLPHAIGPGCTLIEIQEPTDYTLRVEKTTPAGYKIDDLSCHQGIGFEKMFDCFNYDGKSLKEIIDSYKIPERKKKINDNELITLIDYENTECFKMEKIVVNSQIDLKGENEFYGIYILSGFGKLISINGERYINATDQYFIPSVCKEFTIKAKDKPIELIKFYGPKIK